MAVRVEIDEPRLNRSPVLRYDVSHEEEGGGVLLSPPEEPDNLSGRADMDVTGAGSVANAFPIKSGQPRTEAPQTAKPHGVSSPRDEVEISAAAKMMNSLSQSSEIRAERLAQIKADIESGHYDTDAKLEAALEKMLHEVSGHIDE